MTHPALPLPHIPDPQRYHGLFLFDFGTHVSVGYTAKEIAVLLASAKYRGGQAYQIYRVGTEGTMELRGVRSDRLDANEALTFQRFSQEAAKADYAKLRTIAHSHSPPARVDLQLYEKVASPGSFATALVYPAVSSEPLGMWLAGSDFDGGDDVRVGSLGQLGLTSGTGKLIASCRLPGIMDYTDRSAEEILATVDQPLQRYTTK